MAQSFTKWPRLTSGLVIFTLKYGKIYKNWKWAFISKFIFFQANSEYYPFFLFHITKNFFRNAEYKI